MNTLLHYIRTAITAHEAADTHDHELLERFARQRDQDAFAVLLKRYATCVWSVCQRLLDREQDAEDAFQATFLTLARKASSIRRGDALPAWLHGVARRIAANLRRDRQRQADTEAQAANRLGSANADLTWQEGIAILDEELARLPEKYRAVLIVCCLDGRSRDEAASHLGWSQGQVKGRLERARDLLRRRLEARGVQLAALLLAAAVSRASAAGTARMAATTAPVSLVCTTINAALTLVSAPGTTSGVVSSRAVVLMEGVLRQAMWTSTLKVAIVTLVVMSLVVLESGLQLHQTAAAQNDRLEKLPPGNKDQKPVPGESDRLGQKAGNSGMGGEKEQEQLQGVWRVESFKANGITTDHWRGARTLLIRGELMHWQDNEPAEEPRHYFTLPESGKPQLIRIRKTRKSTWAYHGIIQVDKDTLKLCWNSRPKGKPPEAFQESPGIWLLTLKRQKPGERKPEAAQRTTTAQERAKFQGTWVLVSSEREGKAKSEEKNPYRFTVTGDRWKVHRGEEVAVEGTLKLVDVTTTPKQFDLLKPRHLSPQPTVDYGIYEWEGDSLRYCVRNGPPGAGIDTPDLRPKEFTTREGDSRTIYLWKRAKP